MTLFGIVKIEKWPKCLAIGVCRGMAENLSYTHAMEYNVTVKKNKNKRDSYVLICAGWNIMQP